MGDASTVDRVRRLIERAGVSHAQFAENVGLDGPKLSKSLAGKRRFTSLDLARIAEYCGTTVDDLLGIAVSDPLLAARVVGTVQSTAVDQALTTARSYAAARRDLAFLNETPPLTPLRIGARSRGRLVDQGTHLAAEALELLETPSRVLDRDLASTVEQYFDIDVAIEPLNIGFDGLAWRDEHARLILVGTSRIPGRQRFTIAHELGHLLAEDRQDLHLDNDVYDRDRRTVASEMRANAFAAAFLMPESVLKERSAAGLTELEFAALSCDLSVSPSSLAWRLLNLDCIDEKQRTLFGAKSALAAANEAGATFQFAQWVDASSDRRLPTRLIGDILATYLAGSTTLRPLARLTGVPVEVLAQALDSVEDQVA